MATLKDRIASGLGSVLEWYDFSIYGFFAPLLSNIFFSNASPTIGLIKSFSVFAVGFFARPIGALFFGYIADKYGRATCLKLTPLLISIPTFAIALLPSYNSIGLLAPIFLVLFRFLQGLCIGGEFTNNIVYLCESVTLKNRYFLGSIGSCTGSLGILLASTITAIFYTTFSSQNLAIYGWRIGFSISALLGIFIFYLRKNLSETRMFNKLKKTENPIVTSLKTQKIDYLIAIGIISFSATTFYFLFVFLPAYATQILNIHAAKAFGDNSISLFTRILIIPLIGFISDKIGGLLITRISCILFILLSFPIFYILIHYPSLFFYCAYFLAILSTLNAASVPGILMDILPPNTRCTIFSFSFNLCFGIFGGIVPVIGFYIVKNFQNPTAPIYYLIISGIITLTISFLLKNRKKHVY